MFPVLLRWLLSAALVFPINALQADSHSVDREIFERSVKRQMTDRVMGYTFVVADADRIAADASGGWAQAPGDGDIRMGPTIPIGFGSNQKVLSGVALLDLLEDRSNLTLEQELNTPIHFFLPDRWRQAYFGGPSTVPLDRVTLRDVLDHTSGIAPEPNGGGSAGTKIALALSQPLDVAELNDNTFRYNNNNYTLLLYIIPSLTYRDELRDIEAAGQDMTLSEYNGHVALEYGKLYTRYMREQFIPRVPEPVVATCRPGDLPGDRYAKQYDNRDSSRGFTDDAANFCRSQGSWSYSPLDMAHIMRAIELGNGIVRRSTRRLYRPSLPGPRLIYWRSFSNAFLAQETTTDTYRGHGGRTPSLSGNAAIDDRANSVVMRLPFGYVGVAAANSDEMGATALANVLMNAFYEATRRTYEKDTNRGGSDIRSTDFADPDPALCAAACDGRPDCLSWTFVAPGIQHPTNARCWLKDDIPTKRSRAQRFSGVKGLEYGFDRPGSNLRSIELASDDAAACRLRCAANSRCRSWTFVKAGIQGNRAVCWLKRDKPRRKRNSCCVSGVK